MALRPCAAPRCHELVRSGRCPVHAKQQDVARGTAQERGYDATWARFSRDWRQQHPICGERYDGSMSPTHSLCLQQGRLSPAQCVDHIVPMSKGGSQYDVTNLQSLCIACNTAKGNR